MDLAINHRLIAVLLSVGPKLLLPLSLLVSVHSFTSHSSIFAPQFPPSEPKFSDFDGRLEHQGEVDPDVDAVYKDHDSTCVHSDPFHWLEICEADGCIHYCQNHKLVKELKVVLSRCF